MDDIVIKARSSVEPVEWPCHPGDDTGSFEWFRQTGRVRRDVLQVCVSRLAWQRMLTHGRSSRTVEVLGVLVGELVHAGDERFIFIDGTVRAEMAAGTTASVTMTPEAWGRLDDDRERRYPGAHTVGWYHTHPSWGIFLSSEDRTLHGTFFRKPFHVALVLDLARMKDERAGAFVWHEGELVPEAGFAFSIFEPRAGFYERLPRLARATGVEG